MIELNRTEWQIRCAFNAFCKRVLENEATNIYRERKKRQSKEMVFSDLTPQEEKQLYTLDEQDKDKAQGFQVAYVETSCGSHADIARRNVLLSCYTIFSTCLMWKSVNYSEFHVAPYSTGGKVLSRF